MSKILNQKLDLIGINKFIYIAPLISFISDLIIIFYVNKVMLPKLVNDNSVRLALAKANNISPEQLSTDFVNSATDMMHSSLSLMLFCILCCHVVIYLLCLSKYSWPKTYIMGYARSAVFLSIIEFLFYVISEGAINFITFGTTILYFIVAYGYSYFKKKEEL